VVPFRLGEQGLYHAGTRHLSRLDLRLNGARALLLSSAVREDNDLFVVDLTNPDIPLGADAVFRRDVLHIFRSKFLLDAACYERLRLTNHGLDPVNLTLVLRFGADFADIFEVRGLTRARRGQPRPARVEAGALVLECSGARATSRSSRSNSRSRASRVVAPGPRHRPGRERGDGPGPPTPITAATSANSRAWHPAGSLLALSRCAGGAPCLDRRAGRNRGRRLP
jgi:glycogen debranching enzyme